VAIILIIATAGIVLGSMVVDRRIALTVGAPSEEEVTVSPTNDVSLHVIKGVPSTTYYTVTNPNADPISVAISYTAPEGVTINLDYTELTILSGDSQTVGVTITATDEATGSSFPVIHFTPGSL
jgi:hypothetical protein